VDQPQTTEETWTRLLREEPGNLDIEFHSGPRSKILAIGSDGALLVREYGGPIYFFGHVRNVRSQTVVCWRGQPNTELHTKAIDALLDCGFAAERPRYPLYPDEQPSLITVRHGNGEHRSMSVPHRLVQDEPALAKVEGKIDTLILELSSQPRTETMPNPDFDLWSEDDLRRVGPMGQQRD